MPARSRSSASSPNRRRRFTEALKAGRPVDAPAGGIAADSLAPRRVGELMFPIARAHVARVALVTDEAIRRAQDVLWSAVRIVAEPGGAAAFAAVLSGAYMPAAGERVGVVISGGNSTAVDFGQRLEIDEVRVGRPPAAAVDRQDVLGTGGERDDQIHLGAEHHVAPLRDTGSPHASCPSGVHGMFMKRFSEGGVARITTPRLASAECRLSRQLS